MAFKRLLAGLGFGGASVEAVLHDENVVPGGVLRGDVQIEGGSVDQHIERLTIGLRARMEVESGDAEYEQNLEFHRVQAGGALDLQPGAQFKVPFEIDVPWETPLTMNRGRFLQGMNVGLNTQLHVAAGVDPGDFDPVSVHALPAQQAVLDAVERLGFQFKKADVERGAIRGTGQKLPFYQEIEYYAPGGYAGLNELELTFVTDERGCQVVLEMDKKPGIFSEGRDTFHRFGVAHGTEGETDWAGYLHNWIDSVAGKRSWL